MAGFIGRQAQLGELNQILEKVTTGEDKPGAALLIRGRRRVGKSRLVEEFLEHSGVPHVFFTASTRTTAEELQLFSQAVISSSLPGRSIFEGVIPTTWDAALGLLVSALPNNGPAVLVIDELPYLTISDKGFEGTLQKLFDTSFSKNRLLLIGIGSDLAMMEQLNAYNRPFHQRATEMVIPALSPAEVSAMLGSSAEDAFDAHLITGGLPLICKEWRAGDSMWEFLEQSLSKSNSALIVSGERSLAAEFPTDAQSREVLTAIGSGQRTFTKILGASDGMNKTSMLRSLKILEKKGIIRADLPLATHTLKLPRYSISDPHLKFWLAYIEKNIDEVERGRGDRLLSRIRNSWFSWRGIAIEPIIRESLDRLPGNQRPHPIGVIGGYWTRTNSPEIDIVIADKAPEAKFIFGVGSIKWKENAPFDGKDYSDLIVHRTLLPGATEQTPLVVVSRSGCNVPNLKVYSPDDLISAWK
jgi:AAA+ ATPase superfamily predicted ATPase